MRQTTGEFCVCARVRLVQLSGVRYCLFIAVVLLVPIILSLCASSLALLLLAVNQYLAICSPLFAQTRISPGRAGLCVIAAWLTAGAAAASPSLVILAVHYADERRACADYTNSIANKALEVRTRTLCRGFVYEYMCTLCENIGWTRVRAPGTYYYYYYNPTGSQRPYLGGHGRGLDWVRSQTVSRLSRMGHEECRVGKG